MLCKLSLRNIRRSLRDYAIYFFTLVIGVSVFYIFNAVDGQAAMLQMSESKKKLIELLKMVLSGTSVFVAIVLGLLIVYASRFLMKRRSKEFALYMTLGMSKGKISAILLFETIMIGIGSLFVGLLIGIGLSQLMSALVANLFEADMTQYRFTVSLEAVVKTITYFALMYLVVILFNSVIVTRMKLIDLIQSGKRSEQIRLKNPVLCVIIFLLSAAVLAYSYYQVGWNSVKIERNKMAVLILLGSLATFFIFWSMSGMLLRIMMSMKGVYYRGLNVFTFRQISSKINTMVFSITVICLMLFVTICTLTSAFSIRNSMNKNIVELCPADFEIGADHIVDEGEKVPPSIEELYKNCGYDMTEGAESYVNFCTYYDPELTLGKSFGECYEGIKSMYPFLSYDMPEEIVKLSDYNKLMKLYGREMLSLDDGEFIILCNYKSMSNLREQSLHEGFEIAPFGHTLRSKYSQCRDGFIDLAAERVNIGIYVVPDNAVDETAVKTEYFIGNLPNGSEEEYNAGEALMTEHFTTVSEAWDNTQNSYAVGSVFKSEIYAAHIGLGAIVTFLGLYIGMVFLIACGAILALKELSESVDSIPRYDMLRKIGVSERDISKSLIRQSGLFFLLPLLLAIVHSIFGMKFAVFFLESFGTENIWQSITATSVILLLIYGGYYLVTYFCGKRIIKDKK